MPDWKQVELIKAGRATSGTGDPAWYVETEAQRQRIAAYWEWYSAMERRYPPPGARRVHARTGRYLSWLD